MQRPPERVGAPSNGAPSPIQRAVHRRAPVHRTRSPPSPSAPAERRPVAPVAVTQPPRPAPQRAEPGPTNGPGFAELGVPAPLLRVLADQGAHHPFPIQQATLVDALAGRDLLGRGRTGSGKTIAFVLPMVMRLADGAATQPAEATPRPGARAHPGARQPGPHRDAAVRRSARLAHRDGVRRRRRQPADRGAAPRRRHRRRLPGTPGRSRAGPPCPARRGGDHRARRGRPHVRPRLRPRRDPPARAYAHRRSADAVLRHAGQAGRRDRQHVPHRAGGAQRRRGGRAAGGDGPPRVPSRRRAAPADLGRAGQPARRAR